jgi:two-component sensor histidine kinase
MLFSAAFDAVARVLQISIRRRHELADFIFAGGRDAKHSGHEIDGLADREFMRHNKHLLLTIWFRTSAVAKRFKGRFRTSHCSPLTAYVGCATQSTIAVWQSGDPVVLRIGPRDLCCPFIATDAPVRDALGVSCYHDFMEQRLTMTSQKSLTDVKDGHALAAAIVDTVRESLVVLDRELRVITASRSFYQTFGAEPQGTQGWMFYDIDNGRWNIPALRKLLGEIIPQHRTIEAYEIEHEFPALGRRIMLLNARQVFDERHPDQTILLAIEDVTLRREAEREKDELFRQKDVLLQEMQHRVANSLQIIASILQLKARAVQSEEARAQLQDAHHRIMSIATVQQQLQASALGDKIEIGPYLSKLAESLAKSMIGDRRSVSVAVRADAGTAVSSQAVSIGLIVTELVINALKHAFPDRPEGAILVSYDVEGADWRLSVSDNGVGRTDDGVKAGHTGLGTSIVESLARQLDGRVEVSSGSQGTTVSIIHAA